MSSTMNLNKIMSSENIQEIRKDILKIINQPILSKTTINQYISTQLSDVLLNKNKIDTILKSTHIIPYTMERNKDIIYFRHLWFLLKYSIPLNQEYSIFSNETRITKRKNEIGLGRAYNILSNEEFNKANGLGKILTYLHKEKGAKYHAEVYKFLQKDSYKQYFEKFDLGIGRGHNDFFSLMEGLLLSTSYIQRCILLKKYLDTYDATFFSFSNTENIPYTSFRKSYKKHNNSTKTEKTQAFTYIFFQLYKDMTEKSKFDEEMKKLKNQIMSINSIDRLKGENVKKIKNMINKLNNNQKQQYYKQKREALIKAQKKYIYSSNKRVPLNIENGIVNNSLANNLLQIQKNIYNKKSTKATKLRINPNTFTKSQKLRNYILENRGKIVLDGVNIQNLKKKKEEANKARETKKALQKEKQKAKSRAKK